MTTAETRVALENDVRARCDRGDLAGAATAIVRGYGPEISAYLAAVLRGQDSDVHDVFAMFCADLWRGLPTFRFASSVRTWAYTIARHACARCARDDGRRRRRIVLPGELVDIAAVVKTETTAYLRTTMKDRLAKARDQLDPDERTILVLRIDRQLPWRDIARVLADDELAPEALQRREQALRKRFEHIKRRLRAQLDPTG